MVSTATSEGPVKAVFCDKLKPIQVSRWDTPKTQNDAGRARAVWEEICR